MSFWHAGPWPRSVCRFTVPPQQTWEINTKIFLCLLRLWRSSGWSAASLYGGLLPNFDCQRRIVSEQNHCPEAAIPNLSAYIAQVHKNCCPCCCAFKEVVKYGSSFWGHFCPSPCHSLHLSPSPLTIRMGCSFRVHITYLLTYRTWLMSGLGHWVDFVSCS